MFKNTPFALMKFVAKAALNVAGFGVAGELAVDVLPEVARDVWNWWGKDKKPDQLRAEVRQVAELTPAEARRQAEQVVAEEAAEQPEAVRKALTAYLSQVPAAIRQSQRCPADPSGRTLLGLSLIQSDDVLQLLPAQLPRFQPGDRPPGIGDWELEELLGVGGFGEVWRARNPHLTEPVALKFCLDARAAQWLRHEAALLGRVMSQGKHPGIVPLLDTYLNGDPPCLKYEYVAGGDLSGLIAQWRHSPPSDAVGACTRLMHELADVVSFAHQLDPPIVHRDLKPANILLQPSGDGGMRARVADFGIGGIAARQAHEQATRGVTRGAFLATALRGACTPLYASPQQQRGEGPDPRDDVYALGVIWYQMLTGDLLTGASADWREEIEDRRVPEDALRLLGACLASKADKRPLNAAVLAHELAGLCHPASQSEPSARPAAIVPSPATAAPLIPRVVTSKPKPIARPSSALPRQITNILGMKFVLIPAGTFVMGSPPDEAGRTADEGPQHEVTITRPFYLGVYPVTQMQYQLILKTNPSHFAAAVAARTRSRTWKRGTLPSSASPGATRSSFVANCPSGPRSSTRAASIACQRKPSGSMLVVPTRRSRSTWGCRCPPPWRTSMATIPMGERRAGRFCGEPRWLARTRPTSSACTIYTAMSGSGARIGTPSIITRRVRRKIRRDRPTVIGVSCAAAAGAAPEATAAPPTAASSNPETISIASAFACSWKSGEKRINLLGERPASAGWVTVHGPKRQV